MGGISISRALAHPAKLASEVSRPLPLGGPSTATAIARIFADLAGTRYATVLLLLAVHYKTEAPPDEPRATVRHIVPEFALHLRHPPFRTPLCDKYFMDEMLRRIRSAAAVTRDSHELFRPLRHGDGVASCVSWPMARTLGAAAGLDVPDARQLVCARIVRSKRSGDSGRIARVRRRWRPRTRARPLFRHLPRFALIDARIKRRCSGAEYIAEAIQNACIRSLQEPRRYEGDGSTEAVPRNLIMYLP